MKEMRCSAYLNHLIIHARQDYVVITTRLLDRLSHAPHQAKSQQETASDQTIPPHNLCLTGSTRRHNFTKNQFSVLISTCSFSNISILCKIFIA